MAQASVLLNTQEESLIQPGRKVFEYEFPPQLSGEIQLQPVIQHFGGFGDVSRGLLLPKTGESMTVAVKRVRKPSWASVDPNRFERRIRREIVIWSSMDHPHILPFLGYQFTPDAALLVSPWCANGNLEQYIHNNPQLVRKDKIKLLIDSARGLLYLHSLDPPIIHGDIKPQNVMIQDNEDAALCDFGISRIQMAFDEHSGLTTSERTSGTIGYMAKEIIVEEGDQTPSSDVYAFGGLTLAAMSGRSPLWEKTSDGAKILAVSQGQTPSPQNHLALPSDDPLWDLLSKCWRVESNERPAISEVLETLETENLSGRSLAFALAPGPDRTGGNMGLDWTVSAAGEVPVAISGKSPFQENFTTPAKGLAGSLDQTPSLQKHSVSPDNDPL
ncbi:hypothetical protein FRB90_001663 [Tulasnella sp. 427]|nr:hypothetical protein FRB90_001663 [Tulasnella sp. 427]